MVFKFIKDLFSARKELADARTRLIELEREAQELRLQLDEQTRVVKNLTADLERQQMQEINVIEDTVRSEMETLSEDIATPIAQLITQEHLSQQENSKVSLRDVLVLSRRLIKSLERFGICPSGEPGGKERYDSNHHECLGDDSTPDSGEEVIVKMVGISYKGKVIRRSIVVRQ